MVANYNFNSKKHESSGCELCENLELRPYWAAPIAPQNVDGLGKLEFIFSLMALPNPEARKPEVYDLYLAKKPDCMTQSVVILKYGRNETDQTTDTLEFVCFPAIQQLIKVLKDEEEMTICGSIFKLCLPWQLFTLFKEYDKTLAPYMSGFELLMRQVADEEKKKVAMGHAMVQEIIQKGNLPKPLIELLKVMGADVDTKVDSSPVDEFADPIVPPSSKIELDGNDPISLGA